MIGKLLIDWLAQRKTHPNHRQLLLISGNLDWCQRQTEYLLQQTQASSLLLSNTAIIFTNNDEFKCVTKSQISQYKQQLGTEYEVVIYNAFDGLKPSALYAVEGVIGKSGLLVIMCPYLKEWQHYEAAHSGIAFSYNTKHSVSLFISRMTDILLKDENTAWITQKDSHLPVACADQNSQQDMLLGTLSSQQQIAFKSVLNNIQKEKSIALITAKRGRGKSTLLGQIAAALTLQHSDTQIFISAPHINNAQRAQIEYRRVMANSQAKPMNNIQGNDGKYIGLELKFIAPDQVCHLPNTAILIIDEAAAIAPSIVLYACQKFAHTVMATTLAGYEGSGLGFKLRVLPKLQSLSHAFICVELHHPLRWLEDDSLEVIFTRIFAPFVDKTLPHQFAHAISPTHPTLPNINKEVAKSYFHALDKSWLIKHEFILAQVFSLLIQSHYQTTPDDLMRILDASDQYIVALTNNADITDANLSITAVAIIAHEGNIVFAPNEKLLEGIVSSQRRVNGHLVAQNLVMTFCNKWFLTANSWRISRIAVKPNLRRLGFGKTLLQEIKILAQQRTVDYLSTSFGLTAELSTFWQSQGFSLFKIGARRDTSSGEHSGIMYAPLTEQATDTFTSYLNVAINDIDYFLNQLLKNNENVNSVLLTRTIIKHQPQPNLLIDNRCESHATHHSRISQFIDNQRSFVNTAASIYFQLSKFNADISKELYELFLQVQQKNLSKQTKLALLSNLKIELRNILTSFEQPL